MLYVDADVEIAIAVCRFAEFDRSQRIAQLQSAVTQLRHLCDQSLTQEPVEGPEFSARIVDGRLGDHAHFEPRTDSVLAGWS